jgi:hypothetical protein
MDIRTKKWSKYLNAFQTENNIFYVKCDEGLEERRKYEGD